MALYIRVFNSFWNHRKTARLRALLGNDALWIVPRLWAYAAENQPDGDFSKYDPASLAVLLGCNERSESLISALIDAGFMTQDMTLKDWDQHNGYHAKFADRAKNAAEARWSKKKEGNEMKGEERKGDKHCLKHACSMLQASPSNASSMLVASEPAAAPATTSSILTVCEEFRQIVPQFARIPQDDVINTFRSFPEPAWRPALTDFARDMVQSIKLPDIPLRMFRGYLNKAAEKTGALTREERQARLVARLGGASL